MRNEVIYGTFQTHYHPPLYEVKFRKQHVWPTFCKIFSGIPHLTIFVALKYAPKYGQIRPNTVFGAHIWAQQIRSSGVSLTRYYKMWVRRVELVSIGPPVNSYDQILKLAHFGLIFGQFSLKKLPNQYHMLHLVNSWDKNLIFGIWLPYIQRQLNLSGQVTKMKFAFLGTP